MIKLTLLVIFFLAGSCPLKADEGPAGEQEFNSDLDNIKSPFEDGIPKPVIVQKPIHHEETKPIEIPKIKLVPVVPVIKLPVLKVQGVIVGEDIHQAIIDDKVLSLWGTIKGVTVISVTKQGVGLLYKGKKFFLNVD